MDFKHKQLEQELSALTKVFSELGLRLSEVAKEVTAPGVNPSEKLLEQISAARTSFESVRGAIHGHATAMLVSPLPKLVELVSIATIDSLFKASAVAEETKFSVEGEREKALAILGRVLSLIHREVGDFKPLQEYHAKISELRAAVSSVVWPHRHPVSESLIESKHPATDLLHFVENLDRIDDDRWMILEASITESYGKPLFVAASRGKLAVGAESKPGAPPVTASTPAKPAAETVKPVVTAEKPIEKKPTVEKAPEKPASTPAAQAPEKPVLAPAPASAEKKVTAPPATAPAHVAPVTAEKTPQKPVAQPVVIPAAPVPSAAPLPVQAAPAPAPAPEKKPAPQLVPAAAASTPIVPQAAVPAAPAPVAVVAVTPVASPRPQAPAPPAAAASITPAPPAHPPAVAPAMPPSAPSVPAQVPAAAASASNAPAPASPLAVNINSLTALATATETTEKKHTTTPAEAVDKQRKEPRLATPAPQIASRPEPKEQELPETMQQGLAGDGSQRPQRWGFWRGNR